MVEVNEKAEAKAKAEDEKLSAEAKTLGVTRSKISMSGFNVKGKPAEPDMIEKEEAKQNKLADKRLKSRVEQARLDAKKKPIDKRRDLLASRFKAVRSESRAHTYSDKNLKAWLEEYNLILNNPKSWTKLTKNGTSAFIPDNRKKRTTKEILDSMDLEG